MVLFYLITVIPFAPCHHVQIRLKTQIKTGYINEYILRLSWSYIFDT